MKHPISPYTRTTRLSEQVHIKTSSLAPDEQFGHRVVPDHAHQGASRARKPPDRLLVEDRKRDTDIGEQADAADEIEEEQAAQERIQAMEDRRLPLHLRLTSDLEHCLEAG